MDENKETAAVENEAAGVDPVEPEEKGKRGRGRPRKEAHDERPLTTEPPPKEKKNAEDIRNPYAAIHATYRRQVALVEKLRQEHPDTPCGDPVNPLEEKKDKIGAPIASSAFHGPVIGLCKLAGFIGGLEPEELPSQEDYDRCAESWARTSTHLGLKEKTAALFASISETVRVVGFTAGKAIHKAFIAPKKDDTDENASPEAPIVEGQRIREQEGPADESRG